MSVIEAASGLVFFLDTLRNNAPVMAISLDGVHFGAAPLKARYPIAIVGYDSGSDTVTANAIRLLSDMRYQCKAVGLANDPQPVIDLASAIDDALGGDQGLRNVSVTGGYISSCYRENPLLYGDDIAGTKYMHLGGLWRIKNQQRP